MKSTKGVINKNVTKPSLVKREDNRRPIGERHPNSPHFKSLITLRGSSRTWGRALSPFKGPPLRILLTKAIQQIECLYNVNWPLPMTAILRNPNKYCMFHKDTSHWTRDCKQLKLEIEHILSEGYLRDIVDRI